eukprot:181217-Chlamydomonas_euryale.AAC.7
MERRVLCLHGHAVWRRGGRLGIHEAHERALGKMETGRPPSRAHGRAHGRAMLMAALMAEPRSWPQSWQSRAHGRAHGRAHPALFQGMRGCGERLRNDISASPSGAIPRYQSGNGAGTLCSAALPRHHGAIPRYPVRDTVRDT